MKRNQTSIDYVRYEMSEQDDSESVEPFNNDSSVALSEET